MTPEACPKCGTDYENITVVFRFDDPNPWHRCEACDLVFQVRTEDEVRSRTVEPGTT